MHQRGAEPGLNALAQRWVACHQRPASTQLCFQPQGIQDGGPGSLVAAVPARAELIEELAEFPGQKPVEAASGDVSQRPHLFKFNKTVIDS